MRYIKNDYFVKNAKKIIYAIILKVTLWKIFQVNCYTYFIILYAFISIITLLKLRSFFFKKNETLT